MGTPPYHPFELGSVVLTVLPRAPEGPGEENNNSIGLRVRYNTFTALLPGDAQEEERSWWMYRALNCAPDARS